MLEKLKNIIEEETKKLPKIWQDAINFSKWDNITEEIGKKFLLTDEEINNLQTETFLILIGLEEQDSFTSNIESNIGLSKNEALKITEEIKKEIFEPISKKLEEDVPIPPYTQTEIKPIEQPRVVENRPIEPVIQQAPKQETAPISEQTKNIEPIAQPLELNKAPNILEEKLSHPTVNTETVSNYSNPKVDPYRESF